MSPAAAITGSLSALRIVKETAGDAPQFPAASAAFATILCGPSARRLESHCTCHGAAPSHATWTPSTNHFTSVTPTSSEALADTYTTPAAVAPDAGAVTRTV